MAFKAKFVSVVVMAVVLLLLLLIEQQQPSSDHGQIFDQGPPRKIQLQNRKALTAIETKKEGEKKVEWELRKVPSGPDPLHHNGGSPKKPRTP